MLDAYVAHGLGEVDGGVELRCAPEHEAEFFAAGLDHGAYDRLGEVVAPVLLVAGEQSTTHPPEMLDAIAAPLRNVSVAVVPATTHFLPMEDPAAVAGLVAGVAGSWFGSHPR